MLNQSTGTKETLTTLEANVLNAENIIQLTPGIGRSVLIRRLGLTDRGFTSIERRLIERGLAYRHQASPGRVVFFAGRRPAPERITEPRSRPGGDFLGIDWRPEIQRPGCQDFLAYPSRRGNTLHEYRPPMHGCIGNLADKSRLAR